MERRDTISSAKEKNPGLFENTFCDKKHIETKLKVSFPPPLFFFLKTFVQTVYYVVCIFGLWFLFRDKPGLSGIVNNLEFR